MSDDLNTRLLMAFAGDLHPVDLSLDGSISFLVLHADLPVADLSMASQQVDLVGQFEQLCERLGVRGIILDSTQSLEPLNDRQLAEMGLQRIEPTDG